MFDELTIKKNDDNTYSLEVKNGVDQATGRVIDIKVDKIENISIYSNKETPQQFDFFASKDWKINIEGNIIPSKDGELWRYEDKGFLIK
ncbi:hypothetical protein [Paenibacillus sp. XY044]|uniref:hypothetical protein n=1 Tax=Paenibacillus sp. XY044 TaxID=2026089 RepID=UPI000B991BB4|nr:hypothetical protein [Paenibacillus sp. XY044]OZB98089.1 hypothetical protein CJP46_02675 [Paenibacillus sp. XY044]